MPHTSQHKQKRPPENAIVSRTFKRARSDSMAAHTGISSSLSPKLSFILPGGTSSSADTVIPRSSLKRPLPYHEDEDYESNKPKPINGKTASSRKRRKGANSDQKANEHNSEEVSEGEEVGKEDGAVALSRTRSSSKRQQKGENDSYLQDDVEEVCEETAKAPRKADKKLLRRDDRNHWILQEVASFRALRALEELSILPSFSLHRLTNLSIRGPFEDGFFTAILGTFTLHCTHPHRSQPADDNIAYGGCAVLSFLDLYWSPLLRCVVSPQAQSILLYNQLEQYILNYDKIQNSENARLLLKHIADAFSLNPVVSLSMFYKGCRNIVLLHPVPGLHLPDKRYQCPDCGLWYSNYSHHVKISSKCKKPDVLLKRFSIPLYPPSTGVANKSEGTHYRIQLSIPDHRKLAPVVKVNKRLRRRSEVANEPPPIAAGNQGAENALLVKAWLQPSFSNPSGNLAPKLQVEGDDFQFLLGGQSFRCVHRECPPGSDCEIYTGCAVLSFFQICFSPILGAIISPSQKTLLCMNTLRRTLRSRVHGIDEQTLLDHVIQSFGLLNETEEMFDKIHRGLRLKKPILGLDEPKRVYQCQSCSFSFSSQLSFNNHQSSCHPTDSKITYAIRLWNVNTKHRYQATMAQSWIDSHESSSTLSPARLRSLSYSDENAIHLKYSGFQKHIKSWSGDLPTITRLFDVHSAEGLWTPNGLAWKMEHSIKQINRLIGVYLSEAERRTDASPFLRRAITGLHPNSTKFNPITKDSLASYRSYLAKLFPIVLRYSILLLGKDQFTNNDRYKCRDIFKKLGNFRPLLSSQQSSILRTFCRKVHQSNPPTDANILEFIHEFLVSIFNDSYSLTEEVSSILEQIVLVLCLSEDTDGMWRSAGWMYGVISSYFRIAKLTLVQAAVLGGSSARYEQLPASFTVGAAEDPKEPWVDNSHFDDVTFVTLLDEDLDQEPEMGDSGVDEICAIKPFDLVLQNLNALSRLVDPNDKSCLYGRLYHLRQSVQRIARTEPFSSRIVWRDSDRQLALSWAFMEERSFSLSDIKFATFQGVEMLNQACQGLFPVDMWNQSLSALSIESFVDNWDAASIFTCTHNSNLLTPAITELRGSLMEAIIGGNDSLQSILKRSQTFLQCFAMTLYLTAGIPPYARQTVQLQHKKDGNSARNFMLMDGRHGVLIWRQVPGGGYGRKGSDSVWNIPPQVTLPLILYLGVFRPVEVELLSAEALKTKAMVSVSLLNTHIFCNPLKRVSSKSILWTPDDLEGVLKSGPMKMEAFPHRLLFSAIIKRKHADLLCVVQQPSVLDAQGQHTPRTSQKNYAVLQLQHSTGFHFSGYLKQLLACQELHSSSFLLNPLASRNGTGSADDLNTTIHQNQSFALNVARDVVASSYKLAISSPDRAAVISRTAYSNISFFSRVSLPSCSMHFWSDDFPRVVLSLASGTSCSAERSFPTDEGDILRLTASAGTLVLAALSEWFSGELKPYPGDISLLFGRWKELVDGFTAEIQPMVERRLPAWTDYIYQLNKASRDEESITKAENVNELPLPPI